MYFSQSQQVGRLRVLCVCMHVYSPQPQTVQALTNLRTRFCTWLKRSAAPAPEGASQGSKEKRGTRGV